MRDLNTYIPKLLNYLWDQPKLIASILENSDIGDVKKNLGSFFANNFYENIISSYYIEDNLMYVLTLLIKSEINNLTESKQFDKFLNQTVCGEMLTELKRKNDIQNFFKTIISNVVENLELNNSTKKINFNIQYYHEEYAKKQQQQQSNSDKKKIKKKKKNEEYQKISRDSLFSFDSNIAKRNEKLQAEQENFNSHYIPDMNNKVLKKIFEESKNNKMSDYLKLKLNISSNDDNIFCNKVFLDNVYRFFDPSSLLSLYQHEFHIVINFIDKLIENIIENFYLLPYSVKCLCKIISKLILKKFPNISETEKYAYVGCFFFEKLLIPILKNPAIEAFISNNIISGNTINNLETISEIIIQLVKGNFYKSTDKCCDYTPFNWYFIAKMPKIFDIYEHITSVRLPDFIEKLINDQLPEDYQYNYFKENPDEVICYRSICFSLDDIYCLVKNMNKCKNLLEKLPEKYKGLKKTLDKINSEPNMNLLEELKNTEVFEKIKKVIEIPKTKKKPASTEIIEVNGKKIRYYFLLKDLLTNEKYSKLFLITQKTPYFNIKEIDKITDGEIDKKNNIKKVKNFFCSLLYYYNNLVKTDYDEGTTNNTHDILKQLKKFMKSANFVVDGSVPSEWYVNSLFEYLRKIPENLTDNDCENLYNELEEDINKSIKDLDFEALSVCLNKLKFVLRGITYYDESIKLLKDIRINEKTKFIIENEIIPVEILFNYEDEDKGEFEILKYNIKEKQLQFLGNMVFESSGSSRKIAFTIDEFTKIFPNVVKYQELQDEDIFKMLKKLNIPGKLNGYFNTVIQYLSDKKVITEDEIVNVNKKIYDYVMNKIYDKIFPIEPYEEDNKIFQQSVRLSWTEPKHFISTKKNYVFGGFLSDVLHDFEMIDKEKSPRKKFLYVMDIFSSINYLLKFNGKNGGDAGGVDDQIPVLNYAFIKAQPLRMYSNVKYMELFIGERKNKAEGSQLTQIIGLCDIIQNITFKDVMGVSKEEYIKKCNEATIQDQTTKCVEC